MSIDNFDPLDENHLRHVFGHFATGVTVITCRSKEGDLGGITVNSFTSLSLNPPLALWCIDKASDQFDIFAASTHFAVNILSESQEKLSNNFAAQTHDKFKGVDYENGVGGAPILPDVSATLECHIKERIEGGDHIILVGGVLKADSYNHKPLIYYSGRYAKLD